MQLSNRWIVLTLLFFIGLTAPMQFQSVAALAPYLTGQAGLTYTDIGALAGVFMFPGIFLAAPSGLLAARIGDRMTLVAGIALMAVSSVAIALTDSVAVMYVSRLLGGVGAVAVTVLLPKVVTDRFVGKEIATGMSIIASSVGFGLGLAVAVLPLIASYTSWQTATLANAGLCLVAIVLLLLVYRDDAPRAAQIAAGERLWQLDRQELVLSSLAGIGRGLFSAGVAVFLSFTPPLLIQQGMTAVDASVLTSVAALVALISVPLGGVLSDVTGKPNYFVVAGSLGTALSCILLPYIAPALLWIVLFGLLRGGITGGIMSMPSQVLRPQSRNAGFAVVSAMYFVCMAVFPPIAGAALDLTRDAAAPLWIAGLLWFLITVLLWVFLSLRRRWAT